MPSCCRRQQRRKLRLQSPPSRPSSSLPPNVHRLHRTHPLPVEPKAPEGFVYRTARRLHGVKSPLLSFSTLRDDFKTTVSSLDFVTGRPVDKTRPQLLDLMDIGYVEKFISRVKPWVQPDGFIHFDDFSPDPPKAGDSRPFTYHRRACVFATTLEVWMENCEIEKPEDSLIEKTTWTQRSDEAAARWLGVEDNPEWIWKFETSYHNLTPIVRGQGEPPCEPSLPHALCYATDSTPFDDRSVRMSEFKSIVFLALVNNMKAEYNHLNTFGVTVFSFWNRDVRIVQGLVNLKTREIDLRISPVQNFDRGLWSQDNMIDTRFLNLLAWNCGRVRPLPRTK